MRTTVKDVKADRYVHNVQVKVIGSGNDDFVAGDTDLRGVFVADGIHGRSTVIARAEPSRYAFFRGTDGAGAADRRAEPAAATAAPTPTPPTAPGASRCRRRSSCCKAWSGRIRNFQGQQMENLKKIYDNRGQGRGDQGGVLTMWQIGF